MICTTFGNRNNIMKNNKQNISKAENALYSPKALSPKIQKLKMRNSKIFPVLTGK